MINFMKGFGTGLLVQAIAEPTTFMGSCVIDDSDDEGEDKVQSSTTG